MKREDVERIVASINLPGWEIRAGAVIVVEKLHVKNSRRSYDSPQPFQTTFGWEQIENEDELIRTIFAYVQFLADHELREFFTVRGYVVFDPHENRRDYSGHRQIRTSWSTTAAERFYVSQMAAVGGHPSYGPDSYVEFAHGAKGERRPLPPSFSLVNRIASSTTGGTVSG